MNVYKVHMTSRRTGRDTKVFLLAENEGIARGKAVDTYGYHYDINEVQFCERRTPDYSIKENVPT